MHPMLIEYLFIVFSVFVIGTVVGSWLNVCVHRLGIEERLWPALRSLAYPPSHCPRCKNAIAWYDNVPILGWMFLRGRCRHCRGRIAIRYPLIELLTGVLFALLYVCEIPLEWNISGGALAHPYGPATLYSPALSLVHIRFAT
ncbi:MAG: prepilin peptidase, partial [Planctomycetota bacterium]|nr:prepilin peptidase [Planctomycetota bacterium]